MLELDVKPVLLNNLVDRASPLIWHPITPHPRLHGTFSNFVNLKYLGVVPSGSNIKSLTPYARDMHPLTRHIGLSNVTELKNIAGDKFYLAIPTIDNINFSVSTYENRPPRSYRDKFHDLGIKYLNNEYGHIFNDSISNSEQIWDLIDLSKSTGYPGNHYGFANKRALCKHQPFIDYMSTNTHLKHTPIWCVHPKEEFKELDDLKANKIRLFTIPPLDLLYEQIRFSKKSGERLKMNKWSAYGFNPYRGGTNRMARRLLSKRIRLFYDISGWDKFLAILEEMYLKCIFPNSNIPDEYKNNFLWMAFNTYDFMFKTPFGHTFQKNYGNPSGSGATTRDNILAHIIILASALIECYFNKYNEYPSYSLLTQQIVYLFGDDNIMSLDEEFSLILEDDFLFKHFEKYGMKLKFLHGGLDFPIEQMQFLGFYFHNHDGIYIPKYDIQRLSTAVIYQNGRDRSREAYTSRLFILMVMSFPTTEKYPFFKSSFLNWCDYLLSLDVDLTPTEQAFVDMSSIGDKDILQMYTGYESEGSNFNFFSQTTWMEEGIKDLWQILMFPKQIDSSIV